MGNLGCGEQRPSIKDYSFTEEELGKMKEIFLQMSNVKQKTIVRKTIGKKAFQKRLPENAGLALKLYHWIKTLSDNNIITFETYVATMQVLLKEPLVYQLVQFRENKFEKFEIFLQISLEKYIIDKDALPLTTISYTQGLIFFKEIFNIFNTGKSVEHQSFLAPKVAAANIFKNEQTIVSWKDFVLYLRFQFPFLNRVIQSYIYTKFVNPAIPLRLPALIEGPKILTEELLPLLYLANPAFHNVPRLHLLYSTYDQGKNFMNLANAIKGYDAPTLILIKHVEKGDPDQEGTQQTSFICGAFSRAAWRDDVGYQGDRETYLFSLIPRFRKYGVKRTQGDSNYMYLNTKLTSKIGLGFGGKGLKDFRLWIDENMEAESYTTPDDTTFDKGSLLEPYVTKLKIDQLEVWGLGTEDALRGQVEYRVKGTEIGSPAKYGLKESVVISKMGNGDGERKSHLGTLSSVKNESYSNRSDSQKSSPMKDYV